MVRLSSFVSCRERLTIPDLSLLLMVTTSSFICEIQSSVTTKVVRSKRSEPSQSLPNPFVSSSATTQPELHNHERTSSPTSDLDSVPGENATLASQSLPSSNHDQTMPIGREQASQSCLSVSPSTQTIGESRSFVALTQMPNTEAISYSSQGDINIGALVFSHNKRGSRCVPDLNGTYGLLMTQTLNYAIRAVNSDPEVLPGIKLGFAQVPICGDPNLALAQSLSFLPRVKAASLTSNEPSSCRPETDGKI